ncbi:MAG: helix-turn-helix domain-containing protein [Clostridium sp.]|uniref:helix-turn-helix domain-containing protein n=1 Tax=Clostridium sp. TaxID=1506 RepID=UPI002908B093|nr:helix-turn-helix domain-containing protein [Clostridium sp.]MDU5110296.1 helix-turn-helix domain-containing protein [Clostridium sp.]
MLVSKEQIVELYIKQGLTKEETAKKLGIAKTTLWNYCKKYEIENTRFWSDEDTDYLEENYGKYSLKTLAKNLNKSESAIKGKCLRLGLTSALNNTGLLNTSDIAKALGIDRKTVGDFIKVKGLPAKKKVVLKKAKYWRIDIDDFWKWLEKNEDVNLSNLERNILGIEPEWVDIRRKNHIKNKTRQNQNWSKYEVDYLKANYKIKTFNEIASDLKRSLTSVQVKSRKLGLSKMILLPWKPIEVDILISSKTKGITDEAIAEELGRSLSSVSWKRKELLKSGVLDYKYRRARG